MVAECNLLGPCTHVPSPSSWFFFHSPGLRADREERSVLSCLFHLFLDEFSPAPVDGDGNKMMNRSIRFQLLAALFSFHFSPFFFFFSRIPETMLLCPAALIRANGKKPYCDFPSPLPPPRGPFPPPSPPYGGTRDGITE